MILHTLSSIGNHNMLYCSLIICLWPNLSCSMGQQCISFQCQFSLVARLWCEKQTVTVNVLKCRADLIFPSEPNESFFLLLTRIHGNIVITVNILLGAIDCCLVASDGFLLLRSHSSKHPKFNVTFSSGCAFSCQAPAIWRALAQPLTLLL